MGFQKNEMQKLYAYTLIFLQIAYIITAICIASQAAIIFWVMLGLQSAGFVAYFMYFLYDKRREALLEKQRQEEQLAQQQRNEFLIQAYEDLGLKPVYDADGNVIDLYTYMNIEPEYDEFGERVPTVYEMVGQMPRFDKNGKEKPTIFAVKHYVGKVAKGGKNKKDAEGNESDLNKNGKSSELKDQAYKRKLSEKERLEAEKKKLEEEAQQQKEQQKTADKKEVKKDDKKVKKADGKKKGKDSPFSVPKIINPKKGTNFRAEKFGDASFSKKDVKVQKEKAEPIQFQKPIEIKKQPIQKEPKKVETNGKPKNPSDLDIYNDELPPSFVNDYVETPEVTSDMGKGL